MRFGSFTRARSRRIRHREQRRNATLPERRRDPTPPPDDLVGNRDAGRRRRRAHPSAYPPTVATTVTERRLPVAGEWVETGEWLEVRSPYSGEIVGRVAKGGAAETKRAIDAAEAAMREPLPAHK